MKALNAVKGVSVNYESLELEIDGGSSATSASYLERAKPAARLFALVYLGAVVTYLFYLQIAWLVFDSRSASAAQLQGAPQGARNPDACSILYRGEVVAVGALVLLIAIPLIIYFGFGLGLLGPVAGGWFALNQGAGVAAGGIMAWLQALAMGGNATAAYVIAAVGAAFGGLTADQIGALVNDCT
jgi:hypothetical protein